MGLHCLPPCSLPIIFGDVRKSELSSRRLVEPASPHRVSQRLCLPSCALAIIFEYVRVIGAQLRSSVEPCRHLQYTSESADASASLLRSTEEERVGVTRCAPSTPHISLISVCAHALSRGSAVRFRKLSRNRDIKCLCISAVTSLSVFGDHERLSGNTEAVCTHHCAPSHLSAREKCHNRIR